MNEREKEFLATALKASREEMEVGTDAITRCRNEDVRLLAERIVRDHIDASTELIQIATRDSIVLTDPAAAEKPIAGSTEADRDYLNGAIARHVRVIRQLRVQEESARDPALRSFVLRTLPLLEGHLQNARKLARANRRPSLPIQALIAPIAVPEATPIESAGGLHGSLEH